MKPISPELFNVLSSRQYFVADIYTINLASGTTLYYCAGDADLVVNGQLYSAGGQIGPYFDRSDGKAVIHQIIGTEVDQLTVDILPGNAMVLGAPFLTALRYGVFDQAIVTLDQVPMPTYGDTSRGFIRKFVGRVGNVDAGRGLVTFTVNSHLELLNNQLPRNLCQPGCVNSLGDAACQVDLTNPLYNTTGTVVSSTNSVITVNLNRIPVTGAFDTGMLKFSSGVLINNSYGVKNCVLGSPTTVNLVGYMPTAPSPGDILTIYYGCDKTTGIGFSLTSTANTAAGQHGLFFVFQGVGIKIGTSVSGKGIQAGTTVTGIFQNTVYSWALDLTLSLPVTHGPGMSLGNGPNGWDYTFSNPASNNGCTKFSNLARFKGMPYGPAPSMAI